MGKYRVIGGRRLSGDVAIGGSKNAVLPILAGAVLGKKSIIHNCPKISDTYVTLEILSALGCDVQIDGNTIIVDARGISGWQLPEEQVSKMRSSIIFAGALLGRFGRCRTSYPGGCLLGKRPIDLHLKAFDALGAQVLDNGALHIKADRLSGAKICLDVPSVGATQNAMLAAVLAKGATIIENAAREPEVVDLQNFLVSAGAKIAGAGGRTIAIEGVTELDNTEHTIMPDRIVAGTYLAAAAITGGKIRLNNIVPGDIRPVTAKLTEAGISIAWEKSAVILEANKRARGGADIVAGPHPGFPTDMQPQFTTLLATAAGDSVIRDEIFESRDKHVGELAAMGADITNIDSKKFCIKGVERLNGAEVVAHDLRGGAALILAGLGAEGETIVKDSVHVERGYEAIHEDLQALGADVAFI